MHLALLFGPKLESRTKVRDAVRLLFCFVIFETASHCAVQTGLELINYVAQDGFQCNRILLLQPPESCDSRHVPPHPAIMSVTNQDCWGWLLEMLFWLPGLAVGSSLHGS